MGEVVFKKVLYLTFRLPSPPEKGGYNLRAFNIGKILAKNYQVDLLTLIENKEEEKYFSVLRKTFNNLIYFYRPKIYQYSGAFRALFSSKPLQVGYYYSPQMASWIKENHKNYDLIFGSEIRTAEYLKGLKIKKCIDFVDAISLNYQQAVKNVKGAWKLIYFFENQRLLNYEREIAKNFDLSFITTKKDKDFILKGENKKLVVLPNGVKEELLKRKFNGKEENWLSFFGKMDYLPNEDACIFFAQKIFPKIKDKFPNLKFIIVGTSPSKKILNLRKISGVEVTGFVKDPYFYLEKSKIVVAPLRFAGGIQNKILEAMALGKLVFTTPVGAGGIPETKDGEHLIIVDYKNPEEMTKKIVRLLNNEELRQEIGMRARELILENYTWDKVEKKLVENISLII